MEEDSDLTNLEDLLRRAHRDELIPLAETVRVRPKGLGLRQLAAATARALRRRGGHEFANLFLRGGAGPPYAKVVHDLAKRQLVADGHGIEGMERALLAAWMERSWDELGEDQRLLLWKQLDRDGLPQDKETTVAAFREAAPFGHVAGAAALTRLALAASPLAPVTGCLGLWWLGRPRDDLLLPAVLEVARLRQAVRHRVTIGLVGSPSTGKDAAIRVLFGVESGNISPIAGSTREVEITRLPAASALYVVNTPGLGDVVEAITEEARQVLDHIDVYIYVVNAQGGVQARELTDYRACLASGRPVLAVVNKVDTLRPADRERYLDDARNKLGAPVEDFAAVAFDPLPQLADAPMGIEVVREWLRSQLASLGKEDLPW